MYFEHDFLLKILKIWEMFWKRKKSDLGKLFALIASCGSIKMSMKSMFYGVAWYFTFDW